MTILEAVSIVKAGAAVDGAPFRVLLATGFTQLPLEILLNAHLCQRAPDRRIYVTGGLFGDLAGTLERADAVDAVAVAMEWEDLDPRLGVRTLGGWNVATLPDIVRAAKLNLERIDAALAHIVAPVVISLPSLPFPPVAYSSPSEYSRMEAELRGFLQQFAASSRSNVGILNSYELDRVSPLGARFDLRATVASGFPYALSHAEALASLLANLMVRRPPKKGLITDLDDTLWAGILGDAGVDGIRWDLDGKAQVHGIYQQFLASLASAGVLIGIASKNDRGLVEKVFAERKDLHLPAENIFPLEANWGAKSESVANILRAWNIGAQDVIFLDDSPMEVAEVQAVFPQMECAVFPHQNAEEFWALLWRLRESFGKSGVSAEDELRIRSLRNTGELRREASGGVSEQFLSSIQGEISFSRSKQPDRRAFELINKTNQFNLNGVRVTESQWSSILARPDSFVLKLAYRDRFGPLGSIAVLAGFREGGQLRIAHWVMSCRAFSRRIEHQALKLLFDTSGADEVLLAYSETAYNGPLRQFLEGVIGQVVDGPLSVERAQFQQICPALYQTIQDADDSSRGTQAPAVAGT